MKKQLILALAMLATVAMVSCEKDDPENENGNYVYVSSQIDESTTWTKDKIYVIEDGTWVNANLTIEPGTVIMFKSGAWLDVGDSESVTFTANGTADEPIKFTAYANQPAVGAWEGLWFSSYTLPNSSMTFCIVEYAGQGDYPAISMDKKITFNNNTVINAKKDGIYAHEGFVEFNNNTISNIGTHAIETYCDALHTLGINNVITCNTGYGILVRGGNMEATSSTWKSQTVPYIIEDGIWVDQTLTIEAGTVIKFQATGWMDFGSNNNATLIAIGTEENPIVFTSAAATPAPGAWEGLYFSDATSSNTVLEYCTVEYAGNGTDNANIYLLNVSGVTIENCTIQHSSGYGVFVYESTWNNINNTFDNNELGDTNER